MDSTQINQSIMEDNEKYHNFKQRNDDRKALKYFRKKNKIPESQRLTHSDLHSRGAWVVEPTDPTLLEFQKHILRNKFERDYKYFKDKEAYREMLAKKRKSEKKKEEPEVKGKKAV